MQVVLIGTVVAAGGRPPAMYVFGSSILDIGNNNYLLGPAVDRANHPYNGVDFPGSIPTGRFSNGYNIADYVGPCFVSQILNVFICVKMHMDSMLKFIGPSWLVLFVLVLQRRTWDLHVALLPICPWHRRRAPAALWCRPLSPMESTMLPEELGSLTPL